MPLKRKLIVTIIFFKKIMKKYCRHRHVKTRKYYQIECNFIPVIRVYEEKTCLNCKKSSCEKISEYPSCYYDLNKVRQRLERNHIQNRENV